jgi:transcription-repair coupling factor (superfamily II helicase)
MPRQALIMVDNWEEFQNTVQEIEEQSIGLRADYEKDGTLPPDFPLPYLPWTEIQDTLSTHHTLELGPSTAPENSELAQLFSSGPRFGGRLKPLIEHLSERCAAGDRVIVVSRQSPRLLELWSEEKPSTLPPPADPSSSNPLFLEGSLSEGWILTPHTGPVLHLLTDGEIFGWRRPSIANARAIAEAQVSIR